MIYDVTQMGNFRAAKGKRDVTALCQEVGLDYSLYEGDMVSVYLDGDEQPLIQRDEWLVVNTTSHTIDVIDDDLFQDEFWIMN
jgi:propanediol utilization protein